MREETLISCGDTFIPELVDLILIAHLNPRTYYKICLISKHAYDIANRNCANLFQTKRVQHFFLKAPPIACIEYVRIGRVRLSKYAERTGENTLLEADAVITIEYMEGQLLWGSSPKNGYKLFKCIYKSSQTDCEFINDVIKWVNKIIPDYADFFKQPTFKTCLCDKCSILFLPSSKYYTPTLKIVSLYRDNVTSNKKNNETWSLCTKDYSNKKNILMDINWQDGWTSSETSNYFLDNNGNFIYLITKMALEQLMEI